MHTKLEKPRSSRWGICLGLQVVWVFCILTLSGCDRADVQLLLSTPKRVWVILTDPHPERLLEPRPKRDTGPVRSVRSPLVENEGKVFRISGRELTLPNLASSWVEVLGEPAPLPFPKRGPREPPAERPDCRLIWHALGLTVSGSWTTPSGSTLENCSISIVNVYLDVDEALLMYPLSDEARARRPEHSFPGTLIVEGVRIDRGALWNEVGQGWRERGLECPHSTDWFMGGSKSEMFCEHKSRPQPALVYVARLVRPIEAKATTIWGYSLQLAAR